LTDVVSDTHLLILSTLEDLKLVCLDKIYYAIVENYSRVCLIHGVCQLFCSKFLSVMLIYYIYLNIIDRSCTRINLAQMEE